MRQILLNPGPVTLSERVRSALLRPDLCHREPEFAVLQSGIRAKLLRVYDLDASAWASVLLTGSGTAAVEAMLISCVPRERALLVIENGVYGERMRTIATQYGIATISVQHAWDAPIDIGRVRQALVDNPTVSHIAVVQHETTTGRLNQLQELATLCAEFGVSMLMDTVSSFGVERIDFRQWPIAACAATANKCLHGVPGTSFVVLHRKRFTTQSTSRGVYLDLNRYLLSQDGGGTPFTQSIQTFYALDEALDEFFDAGGVSARRNVYEQRMDAIRRTLLDVEIQPLLAPQDCSCVLHAYKLASRLSYEDLHDALKAAGFIIYAGQGNLAAQIFRISAMGDIQAADLKRLQTTLVSVLRI